MQSGWVPLGLAVLRRNHAVTSALLKAGADVNVHLVSHYIHHMLELLDKPTSWMYYLLSLVGEGTC